MSFSHENVILLTSGCKREVCYLQITDETEEFLEVGNFASRKSSTEKAIKFR